MLPRKSPRFSTDKKARSNAEKQPRESARKISPQKSKGMLTSFLMKYHLAEQCFTQDHDIYGHCT